MKRIFKLSLLLLALLLPATAAAYDFEVDGIFYNINGNEAIVTYQQYANYSYQSDYNGDVNIPESVTYNGTTYTVASIGNSAFYGCSGLTSITIPNSVTIIGYNAFSGCSGLTSVTIPNSVTSIRDRAFSGCAALDTLNFNAVSCADFSHKSSDHPFSNTNISTINIGNNVQYVPSDYAHDFTNLTSVTIGNSVTAIGYCAFYGCSGLTSVSIPNSVTEIGTCAFQGCSGLTSVNIGNSVKTIGESVFYQCSGLTSVTIPNSVTSIGGYAFSGCSGLTGDLTIPNSVTTIGYNAFEGCSGLTSVTIGNSVTTIGFNAFYQCSELTSVTIGNSVTSIGGYAFFGCSRLTSVNIPNSVTSIGYQAFSGTAWLDNQSDGLVYAGQVAYKYKGYMPDGTNITLLDGTRGIAGGAFYNCAGLTSVNIPNSVTTIGELAFEGCNRLTSVNIPNSVTTIGNHAFYGTAWLDNQSDGLVYAGRVAYTYKGTMPDGTSITLIDGTRGLADYAFYGCSGLTSITIPNSVTTIGNYAFSGCRGLTGELTIPNSVTSIGNHAFSACSGLTGELTIPNSVTNIGIATFISCSGLTNVTIPNSVTTIGNSAFYSCSGLTSVTIGNSVTSIGDWAFDYCNRLDDVFCFIDEPTTITIGLGFYNYNSNILTLHVPAGSLEAYQADTKWSRFFSFIVEMEHETVFATSIELNETSAELTEGETLQLTATVLPEEATDKTVTWTSSDEAIATVDGTGLVTAVAPGTATITATTNDGSELSASCYITVVPNIVLVASIELNETSAELTEGETLQLTATVLPEEATDKTVTWASSEEAVATVNADGLVTAVAPGEATITATTNDGSELSASCVVTVTSPVIPISGNALLMADTTVMHGDVIALPVAMTNDAALMAFQTDIFLPEGFTIVTDEDDEYLITPSERLSSDHVIMSDNVNNGAVRVICYSPNEQPISDNEGDLFYIHIQVPGDAEGDYTINLRNTLLTTVNYNEISAPDASAVIEVIQFIPGDVNNNHTVNVTDIVVAAQYILDQNPSPFVFEAADMNGDGNVTVTDIMLIAYLINHPTMNAPKRMPALMDCNDRLSGEGVSLMAGETRTVSIALENEMLYTAFQLDLTLPEGLTASNFQLTDRAGSHAFDVSTLSNGKTRVLCYSPAIEVIDGNSGALLTFDVTANATVEGDITVDGIELVTTDCQTVLLNGFAIGVNTMTSVNEVASGKTVARVDYFNLAGQRIDRPESGVTLVVTTYTDGTRTTTKVIQ